MSDVPEECTPQKCQDPAGCPTPEVCFPAAAPDLVTIAAAVIEDHEPVYSWNAPLVANEVLAAVLPDVRRAAVDRDALAEALCQRHQQASPTRIPCAACSQDAADLAAVLAERDALAATVERVRALHSQETSLLAPGEWCPACGDETPCRTIRALHGEEASDAP